MIEKWLNVFVLFYLSIDLRQHLTSIIRLFHVKLNALMILDLETFPSLTQCYENMPKRHQFGMPYPLFVLYVPLYYINYFCKSALKALFFWYFYSYVIYGVHRSFSLFAVLHATCMFSYPSLIFIFTARLVSHSWFTDTRRSS